MTDVDPRYAMSSFLQFRAVYDPNIRFAAHIDPPRRADTAFAAQRKAVDTPERLYEHLAAFMERETSGGKAALALSGGIDSAICAKFMPKGSVAYTFKCVVPGKQVTDETQKAKRFCAINGLQQRVVEVFWPDYAALAPELFRYIRAPFHSIDVQIYKAALQARRDGFDTLIFGQGADLIYGGFDHLLAQDWLIGEFIDRYSCVIPYKALKDFAVITAPYAKYEKNGYMALHDFLDDHLFWEDIHSYHNSCAAAGVKFAGAYMDTVHKPLDISRVRRGESKYLVREVFKRLYPDTAMAEKTPMPRPMDEWLENWSGPRRPEFWPNCHISMTGDQKYYIWILEKFLDFIGETEELSHE
ncbi:MAG: asparagine synthase C-terminal domain-containing protein [Gracilibacteraceae bacterium]|jgi:asparagine synthetase B (glutamine-hydrolysing)|nr:asparagine synthase C-terminal domain-containing protein [Gracilibacteraceae bacterium]